MHSEIREAVARRNIVFIFHRCTHFSNFSLSHRSHRLPFDVDRSIKNRATTLHSTIFAFKSSVTRWEEILQPSFPISIVGLFRSKATASSVFRVENLKILFKKRKWQIKKGMLKINLNVYIYIYHNGFLSACNSSKHKS